MYGKSPGIRKRGHWWRGNYKQSFVYCYRHKTKKGNIQRCHIIQRNLSSGDTLMTKESAIIKINHRIIFFLLSCLGICYSSSFKQIHKLSLYPTQCSSQESSKTMSAKSFVLISMAVDPVLNLLACLLYYNVEKSSYSFSRLTWK